jgi:hypothetical protein
MALSPLYPPVKEALTPGWEVLVTEGGRTGRGLRVTVTLFNGTPQYTQSLALGSLPEQETFIAAVAPRCGCAPAVVAALLPKLAYTVEETLRQMAATHRDTDGLPGQPLTFEDLDPWEAPVDGASLLTALAETYTRYSVLPSGAAEALALWTVHTYAEAAAEVLPYIVLTSPQKRCGKSTVLAVASGLAARVVLASNISPAALFRTVDQCHPTLLIDEADTFAKDNEELRGILNSGHSRRTAYVIRTVGEEHEPRKFSTWGPKMLASIGSLPGTIEDRAILVPMKRRMAGETIEKWREASIDTYEELRRQCLRWTMDHLETLRQATPTLPAGLDDRAMDNWTPLCAIAEAAGGAWPERTNKAIMALTPIREESAAGIVLLQDLQALFGAHKKDWILSSDLVERLKDMEERPWPEWSKGKSITARQVARLLAPFEIHPKPIRDGAMVGKGYRLEDCTDAFFRYLGISSVTRLHSSNDADLLENRSVTTSDGVTDEKAQEPTLANGCNRVIDRNGGREEKTADDCADTFSRSLGGSIRDTVTNEQRRGDTAENVTDEKTRDPTPNNGWHGVTDRKGGAERTNAFRSNDPCPNGCVGGRLRDIGGGFLQCKLCRTCVQEARPAVTPTQHTAEGHAMMEEGRV